MSPSFLNISKLSLLLLKYVKPVLWIRLFRFFLIQQKFSTYLNPQRFVIQTSFCNHSFSNQINKKPALTIFFTSSVAYIHACISISFAITSILVSFTNSSMLIFPGQGDSPGNKSGGSI